VARIPSGIGEDVARHAGQGGAEVADLGAGASPGSNRTLGRLSWIACLFTVTMVGTALVLDLQARPHEHLASRLGRWIYVGLAIPLALAGALVAARRPRNRIAGLMLAAGASIAVDQLAWDYFHAGENRRLPGLGLVGWLGDWVWTIPAASLVFALLLYPDGRLPSRRWRLFAGVVGAWFVTTLGCAMLGSGIYNGPPLTSGPPLTRSVDDLLRTLMPALFAAFPFLLAAAAGSAIARYRRASGDARAQLKWLAYAGALVAAVWSYPASHEVGTWARVAANLSLWSVPAAICIAVLRYRLYDIDRIISRTLAYAALTACVVATYLLAVMALAALFRSQRTDGLISLTATAVVAVLFAPLRDRVQRGVDRLLFGQRNEPYSVISRLGRRLAGNLVPDAVLPTIVDTVAQALKLSYAAIELHQNGAFEPACVHGSTPAEAVTVTLPLTYNGELLGRLVLGPRGAGESFSGADLRLLHDLARHAGIAVHASRLTADLKRSRERLVMAREEERRRLRRDLHDGVGPVLAGMVYQLEALPIVLHRKPGEAEDLLARLKTEIRETIAEVRRLVDDLRPPNLDELGLVPAIRRHAERLTRVRRGTGPSTACLDIAVRAPRQLPPLPAAVEVAAYRIATEALTNVIRHAHARHCTLTIRITDALEVEVIDDGRGTTPAVREGTGLLSMRERADELGGTWTIEPGPHGGTRVSVRLPVAIPATTPLESLCLDAPFATLPAIAPLA
jgi:two-component system NarL family sensor kinase